MNIVLAALNANYIHTPLGIWCLEKAIKGQLDINCVIIDKTINDDIDMILSDILECCPDVVCFSVYIWNVMNIRRLVHSIKQIDKKIRIVLGGPEVSYGVTHDDDLYKYSDCIIKGEGETALCNYLINGTVPKGYCIEPEEAMMLPDYDEKIMEQCKNRLIYFETTRGCPYSCTYCLSSDPGKVRYFDIDKVKVNLLKILSNNKRHTIKFVDRTFNCNKERAKQLIRFINQHGGENQFHLELVPDLIDDETISLLNESVKGTYRIEAGLQTTNELTLQAVKRRSDPEKALLKIKKLRDGGRVHIHLDLIIGLPLEDMGSIKKSFNDAYALNPHELQIGFLKFLKGAPITDQAGEYGYKYSKYPPYEILGSRILSFTEIISLKKIESVFDRVYNSKLFITALSALYEHFGHDAFMLYDKMTTFLLAEGFFMRKLSYKELADKIDIFASEHGVCVTENIVYDHLSVSRGFALDKRFGPLTNVRKEVEKALFSEHDKSIMKRISFYPFKEGIRVFFHDEKDPLSGYFKSMLI